MENDMSDVAEKKTLRSVKKKLRGLSRAQYGTLKERTSASKNLYNQALYAVRQAYLLTGEYLNYNAVDRLMKETLNLEGKINYRLMKAQTAQQTLRRLDTNYKSFFRLLKARPDMNPGPPKYIRKERHNVLYPKQSFQTKDGHAVIEKGLSVKIPRFIADKRIVQIEIVPKFRCFEAVFVYEDDREYEQADAGGGTMAVDLGLDNLAVCTTDGVIKPFAVDGRKLKSVSQYYNKRMSEMKSALDRQRPGAKWSASLQNLTDSRSRRVGDYLHKASAAIVGICAENGISEIVIGNVSEAVNGIDLGKRTNQNFVSIALGQFVSKIRYKAESRGIKVAVTDESYTSRASFADNDPMPEKYDAGTKHSFRGKRIHRGLYRSENGLLINADVNASYNILRKSKPEFTFSELKRKVKEGVAGWLHPCSRLKVI